MSPVLRIARHLPAVLLISSFARPAAGQQEKPVDPDSLGSSGGKFGLVINGFAAGNFNYNFNTNENSFDSSVLAVSLYRALSDRVSFFGQVTVSREEAGPFVADAQPSRIRPLASRRVAQADTNSFQASIDNLQVSWAADPASGLSIVFGKFDSPLAIERDDAPLNFQATPSPRSSSSRRTRGFGAKNSCTDASRIPPGAAARRSGSAICFSLTTGWRSTGRSLCAPITSTTSEDPEPGAGRSCVLSLFRPST